MMCLKDIFLGATMIKLTLPPHPCTDDEWEKVCDFSGCYMRAMFVTPDSVIAEQSRHDCYHYINELIETYGNHPVLLETQARFCKTSEQAIQKLQEALFLAQSKTMPTFSIREALAGKYEVQGDHQKALEVHAGILVEVVHNYEALKSWLSDFTSLDYFVNRENSEIDVSNNQIKSENLF
ncbi:hypothetical protein [Tuwongella immobilis]|uniref:hypothetical protein n=1 Tax=Tuwongella immobilis TaxID=692036 RepID=UPI001E355353|nr:hypothetical protein [Tuwongella immobilis]